MDICIRVFSSLLPPEFFKCLMVYVSAHDLIFIQKTSHINPASKLWVFSIDVSHLPGSQIKPYKPSAVVQGDIDLYNCSIFLPGNPLSVCQTNGFYCTVTPKISYEIKYDRTSEIQPPWVSSLSRHTAYKM